MLVQHLWRSLGFWRRLRLWADDAGDVPAWASIEALAPADAAAVAAATSAVSGGRA